MFLKWFASRFVQNKQGNAGEFSFEQMKGSDIKTEKLTVCSANVEPSIVAVCNYARRYVCRCILDNRVGLHKDAGCAGYVLSHFVPSINFNRNLLKAEHPLFWDLKFRMILRHGFINVYYFIMWYVITNNLVSKPIQVV